MRRARVGLWNGSGYNWFSGGQVGPYTSVPGGVAEFFVPVPGFGGGGAVYDYSPAYWPNIGFDEGTWALGGWTVWWWDGAQWLGAFDFVYSGLFVWDGYCYFRSL